MKLFPWMLTALLLGRPVWADPCGMVPPISLDGVDSRIERVGQQNTYAFFKDGLETVVIHPGFRGNVDEFGMLIPFPAVPSLRKIPDETFAQLGKALDPPVITYWLWNNRYDDAVRPSTALSLESGASRAGRDEVVVLKEEAVGMYEVAVLEAGSASALKRWMDQHGYRFPDGMEPVCADYVQDGWCFVAVKTRVGSKKGVDPQPGMRATRPDKPKDSVFTGNVQAMGFRFYSKEFVVPMRLSTFNGENLNNTLYVLSDQPLRASNLPVEMVKRQLTGEKLYHHLTGLLPYRIEGGTEEQMTPADWEQLKAQRNPLPHNGVAGELFASDLLAEGLGQLSHSHEEKEKALLDIGERLGLRGGGLDAMHVAVLEADLKEVKAQALDRLNGMTLTLIEGDFPREVLANENLRFAPYRLDAIEGWDQQAKTGDSLARPPEQKLFGAQPEESLFTAVDWIDLLDQPERKKQAIQELQARRAAARPYLVARYKNESRPLVERGYCLALLAESPDDTLRTAIWEVVASSGSPLIQLWSRAALVGTAQSPEELLLLLDAEYAKASSPSSNQRGVLAVTPELQRPIALKLQTLSSRLDLEQQLRFLGLANRSGQAVNVSPNIQDVVGPALRSARVKDLVDLMLHSDGQEVRQLSAALLAGFTEDKRKLAFAAVMEGLRFDRGASKVPWAGGALFLPGFGNMSKPEAQELITALTRWSVWADIHKVDQAQVQPLENNLRSYSLWTAAGGGESWRNAHGGTQWLEAYGQLKGPAAVTALLDELDLPRDSPYRSVGKTQR
jgi:hypothetical protein